LPVTELTKIILLLIRKIIFNKRIGNIICSCRRISWRNTYRRWKCLFWLLYHWI